MIDIEKLKELAEAATRGAWRHTRQGVIVAGPFRTYTNGSAQSQIASFCVTSHEEDDEHQTEKQVPNALFSAAAHPDVVLELIAMASAAAPQVVVDERAAFEAWIVAAFDECGEDEPNLTLDEDGRYTSDMRVLTSWQVWQARAAFQAAPAQVQELRKPTDISQRLREYAGNNGYSHNDYADTMRVAADECERFYGGMVAWKETAQQKDKTIIDLRARLANHAPVQPVAVAVPDGMRSDMAFIAAYGQEYVDSRSPDQLRALTMSLIARANRALFAAPAAQGDAKDAERYRYIRDTGTLDAAVWSALEGYGCADEGDIDQVAYAAGMDQAIDAAIAAKAAP